MRAEAGEAQARAAVDQFLTRVTDDALLKAPGLQALRRDLLRSALRFYDEFLKQRGDDPGLRAALADVQLKVGKIQQDLGDAAGAQKSFRGGAIHLPGTGRGERPTIVMSRPGSPTASFA